MGKSMITTNRKLIDQAFRSIMITMMITGIIAMIGSFIDSLIIGNFLGSKALAAFGYASPVYMIIAALGSILANGGKVLCSVYIGKNDTNAVRENFTVSCIATLIMGIVVTIVCLTAATPLALLLGAKGELTAATAAYIRGLGIGAVPILFMQVLSSYICLDDAEKLVFFSVLGMTVVNVTLDLFVALVWHNGLLGMALATSVSYTVAVMIMAVYFRRKNRLFVLKKPSHFAKECGSMFATGFPNVVSKLSISLTNICLNKILFSCGGVSAVSAFSVQSTIFMFVNSAFAGLSSGVSMFSGMYYGEKNKNALKSLLAVALKYGFLLSFSIGAVTLLLAPQLAGAILKGDAATMSLAARSIRLLSISFPLETVILSLTYYYLAVKRITISNILCVVYRFVLNVSCAWIFSMVFGINGVWLSYFAAGVFTLPVLLLLLLPFSRGMKGMEYLLALPRDFEEPKDQVLEISMNDTMDHVIRFVSQVREFCREKGLDEGKNLRICLAIEEMVGNIVKHGSKGKKANNIDIRILLGKEDIAITIRDNGIRFNPLLYSIRKDQYGLQLVQGITKKMDYNYIAGTNCVHILI